MARLWDCAIFVLHSPLVRAIHYSNPPTVTVGQTFTVTWSDAPQNPTQFGIGIPFDNTSNHVNPQDLTTVNDDGQSSGTIILTAPNTPGQFNFGAYHLDNLNVIGMSGPLVAVAAGDSSASNSADQPISSNDPTLSSSSQTIAPQQTRPSSSDSKNTDTTSTEKLISSSSQIVTPVHTASLTSEESGPKGSVTSNVEPTSTTITTSNGNTSSKSNNPTLILSLTFGILSVILLTILLFFLYRKHKKRKQMLDDNSEWSSYFENSDKRSSNCSSSLGPYDSISQVGAPAEPKRRILVPSTLLSTGSGYSDTDHSSVTLRGEETGYQKCKKDRTELDTENKTSYIPFLP